MVLSVSCDHMSTLVNKICVCVCGFAIFPKWQKRARYMCCMRENDELELFGYDVINVPIYFFCIPQVFNPKSHLNVNIGWMVCNQCSLLSHFSIQSSHFPCYSLLLANLRILYSSIFSGFIIVYALMNFMLPTMNDAHTYKRNKSIFTCFTRNDIIYVLCIRHLCTFEYSLDSL